MENSNYLQIESSYISFVDKLAILVSAYPHAMIIEAVSRARPTNAHACPRANPRLTREQLCSHEGPQTTLLVHLKTCSPREGTSYVFL